MMSDHATTGGYTVIAAVISSDLSKASQLVPGDRIRFEKISPEAAHEALRKQKEEVDSMDKALNGTFLQRLLNSSYRRK